MTSIAFIAGSVPLLLSEGAGSEVRKVTGITVFSGMVCRRIRRQPSSHRNVPFGYITGANLTVDGGMNA
jgi:hypothetical protein